jgi:hypothetical protein
MTDPTPSPLVSLLSSRKTALGLVAVLGTILIVAIGTWRGLEQLYVGGMIAALVSSTTTIINALGKEDAARAMPALSQETVTAATVAAVKHLSLNPPPMPVSVPTYSLSTPASSSPAGSPPRTVSTDAMLAVRVPGPPSVPDIADAPDAPSLAPPPDPTTLPGATRPRP